MHRSVIVGIINSTRNGQRVCVATGKRSIERINQTDHQSLDYVGACIHGPMSHSLQRETGES